MKDWQDIQNWRFATRKKLLAERATLSREQRFAHEESICTLIAANFPDLTQASIGFYWPIRHEVDLRPMIVDLLVAGADAALPVVVREECPMEFWDWNERTPMSRGLWNIPIPAERHPVNPTVLLIPVLGFDQRGYRLGYGGGYYDRTLDTLRLKPLTIGVGFDLGRLETIYPQSHDYPLDAMVTESGCRLLDRDETSRSRGSSPPCFNGS